MDANNPHFKDVFAGDATTSAPQPAPTASQAQHAVRAAQQVGADPQQAQGQPGQQNQQQSRRPSVVVIPAAADAVTAQAQHAPATGAVGSAATGAVVSAAAAAAAASSAKNSRRFRSRSRSLPNIWLSAASSAGKKRRFNRHRHGHRASKHLEILLPPVNLHSMQEIDLNEVLKNPQLRHDIIFDPQIQFRPNMAGERGERKRTLSDNYWQMITTEISHLLLNGKKLNKGSPVLLMFDTLRGILLSLISPNDDKLQIKLILETNMIQQQLNNQSFDFVSFANWVCKIFKLHCAPMRDQWIDELNSTFIASVQHGHVDIVRLVDGMRTMFSILEAMKLDVANHQIRLLRPLLCSNVVEFEREYFRSMVLKNKFNLTSSQIWFKKIMKPQLSKKVNLINGLVDTLSCSKMVSDFPNTFIFDHNRLISLRTDLRHIICLQMSIILFKMMYSKHQKPFNAGDLFKFKSEIMPIILDSNGNTKWTKNVSAISIQLMSKLGMSNDDIQFAQGWLINQTQPSSQVYKLMETKLFNMVKQSLQQQQDSDVIGGCDPIVKDDLKAVLGKLRLILDLNYQVFEDISVLVN